MTLRLDDVSNFDRARDIVHATDAGRPFATRQSGRSVAGTALACAVLALAAIGLAELLLLIAQHWIGAAQVAVLAGMAGCAVWAVAAGRNWRWPR